jgi:hypothetical protein
VELALLRPSALIHVLNRDAVAQLIIHEHLIPFHSCPWN